jgi:hypothetical protein
MAQTYGVAHAGSAEPRAPTTRGSAEDDSLLLQQDMVKPDGAEGHASLSGCVGNLTNTIIGSGACFCLCEKI